MRRIVLAFVVSPAIVPLALAAYGIARGYRGDELLAAPVIAAYLFVITLAVGLPALVLYRRRRWNRWWQFALAGAIVVLVLFGPRQLSYAVRHPLDAAAELLPFLTIGVVCALAFWIIGVWRNPWFLQRTPFESVVAARLASAASTARSGIDALRPRVATAARELAAVSGAGTRWGVDWWRRGERRAPVCGVAALALPLIVLFVWLWLEHADLRWLGHAAMGVYILLLLFTTGAAVVLAALVIGAVARRERFLFLPFTAVAVALVAFASVR